MRKSAETVVVAVADDEADEDRASKRWRAFQARWKVNPSLCIGVLLVLVVVAAAALLLKRVVVPFLAASGTASAAPGDPSAHVWHWRQVLVLALLSFASSLPVPALYTVSCIGSGYILGLGGVAVVLPCGLLGMAAAFVAARRWLRASAHRVVERAFPSFHALVGSVAGAHHRDDATARSDERCLERWWRRAQTSGAAPVALLRLTPVPFAVQTMFWASCTRVPLPVFVVGSSVVVVPQVALFVFIGHRTTNLLTAFKRGSPLEVTLLVVGVVVLAGLGGYVARATSKRLRLDGPTASVGSADATSDLSPSVDVLVPSTPCIV